MSKAKIKFYQECPAFARAMGITSLKEWKVTSELALFNWGMRHDRLDELKADGKITDASKIRILRVLEKWDDGAAVKSGI